MQNYERIEIHFTPELIELAQKFPPMVSKEMIVGSEKHVIEKFSWAEVQMNILMYNIRETVKSFLSWINTI